MISGQEISRSESCTREDLQMWLEEADVRVIAHIHEAVSNSVEPVVVLSNDTDVVVLLLCYIFDFSMRLKECWIRVGTSEKTRFIPIHTLERKLGHRTCSAVMKAHILTGCDVTSRTGTKTAAIKASPESYQRNFGEENNPSAEAFLKAEEYLVRILDKNSPAKSFDELRYLWHKNKNKSLSELPPTSHSLQSHLERSFIVIRNSAYLINENPEPLDPLESGWKVAGKWLESGWKVAGKWLERGRRHFTTIQVSKKSSSRTDCFTCTSKEMYMPMHMLEK